jgi:hypothetical protein
MQKNPGNIFESLQVDPITGKYFLVIPEQLVNELSWYEDTKIKLSVEGDELILSEQID